MKATLMFIAFFFIFGSGNICQAQPKRVKPKTASKPAVKEPTEEELRERMVPRSLSLSFTINGGSSFSRNKDTTVEWSVNRSYSASTELRKLVATCDVRTCDVVQWLAGENSGFMFWEVSANDTMIERTVYRRIKPNDETLTWTRTTTLKCSGRFEVLNGAIFFVNIQDRASGLATATAGMPFPSTDLGPGVCVSRTITRGRPNGDPPDEERTFRHAPNYSFPDSVEGFKASNFQGIEFPILANSLLDAANKSFTFTTPVLEANDPYGWGDAPDGRQKVKMKGVVKFN